MVKILHLYPKLMNLYGDYANIAILKKHLEDQGLKVSVQTKEIDEKINFDLYDFIYMGSGTETNLKVALHNIIKYKNEFISCVEKGKNILFTGNAMELLGKCVDNDEALGIFDFETKHTNNYYGGNVVLKDKDIGFIVGHINRTSIIIASGTDKLFDYFYIDGTLVDNAFEGFHKKNIYGTHLLGPVLVKNPNFLLRIVRSLMPRDRKFKEINYENEEDIQFSTINTLKENI